MFKQIQKSLFILSFMVGLIAASLPAAIDAGDLYAILLADTKAENLEESTVQSLNKMRSQVKKIAYYTKLNLKEVVLRGEGLYAQDIFQTLQDLPITSNDVVIFYYNGHGYRTPSKTNPWPNMLITNQMAGIDLQNVASILINKSPRLIIALADVCNNIINEKYAPPVIRPQNIALSVKGNKTAEGYRKLFLNQRGVIIIDSAKVGEISWANPMTGALYTVKLLEKLEVEVLAGNSADWNHLLEESSKAVADKNQHPQHIIYNQ
jgi:hypothetical protein